MPKQERCGLSLDDDDGGRLHVTWSRSGKRLIVTATTARWEEPRQVELDPNQVQSLIAFLSETAAFDPGDR